MANSFVTDAGTLVIPGSYPIIKVQTDASGLSTTGVLMLVGEADAGGDYSTEEALGDNAFGPDQTGEVVTKYKSGPLVDAFKEAAAANADSGITGSFSRAVLVKTNVSLKAKALLAKASDSASTWATLADRSFGKAGNNINYQVVTKTAEGTISTTFNALSPQVSTNLVVRVNGGAGTSFAYTAGQTPANLVTTLTVAGLTPSGGVDRNVLPVTSNASATVSGNEITITLTAPWANTPTVGDTMIIPSASPFAAANVGSYIVKSATTTTVVAKKIIGHTTVVNGDELLPPVLEVGPLAMLPASNHIECYSPVTVSVTPPVVAPFQIDGVGKTLEIADADATAVGRFSYVAVDFNQTSSLSVPHANLSTVAAPKVIKSTAEYVPTLKVARSTDNISEELTAGGQVVLNIGYKVTTTSDTAVLSIDSARKNMTITFIGGLSSVLSPITIRLADYPTVRDLSDYIASIPGFVSTLQSNSLGSRPSTSLDAVSNMGIATTRGTATGRLKDDSYRLYTYIRDNSVLVQIGDPAAIPLKGLPGPTAVVAYLSGGTKGSTSDQNVSDALLALEMVRGNFVVPLFSRDATADIDENLTDENSSYTIVGINASAKSHVLKMSTTKKRRNRQAFLSERGKFSTVKASAGNLAHPRCNLFFQDVKVSPNGTIVQRQPWMAAVKFASMQGAAFYRPLVHKLINISGVAHVSSDVNDKFNDQSDTMMEEALEAGLTPITKAETGGFYWVSDQTTYGQNSFIYNSAGTVYNSDVVALTVTRRMEDAFVGQSIADASATSALTVLKGVLEEMARLKLISPSDDAPTGYKNAKVKIQGTAMICSVEIKVSTAILFIPISFVVSQISQSA